MEAGQKYIYRGENLMLRDIVNYKLVMETLGNVHVGNGEKLSTLDYVFDSKSEKYGLLDPSKWMGFLSDKNFLEEYLKNIESKGESISNYLWLVGKGVDPWEIDLYRYIIENVKVRVKQGEAKKLNDIAGITKNVEGKPYIPGSSIKGMLRTALLSVFLYNNKTEYQKEMEEITQIIMRDKIEKKELKRVINTLEKKVFNKIKSPPEKEISGQVKDLLRGIIISDSSPESVNMISIKQKLDYGINTKKEPKSLPIWREVIKPGAFMEFQVGIDRTLIGENQVFKSIEDILSKLHYFWETIIMPYEKNFAAPLKDVNISTNESPLVYIGGGVGFHTKSIIYALSPDGDTARKLISKYLDFSFKNTRRVPAVDTVVSPRTLKLSEDEQNYVLMGLCRLRVVKNYAVNG